VVGAACARELHDAGLEVRVLDGGVGRAAASWAAVGLLSPSAPQELPPSVHSLATLSFELWDDVAARHPEVELRRVGLVLLGQDPEWLRWRAAVGLPVEPTAWHGRAAHRFPEVAAVRSNRCAGALLDGLEVERRQVRSLTEIEGEADVVVLAAGAWATPLLREAGLDVEIVPVRGQMLLFGGGTLPTAVIDADAGGVAVPRADGRVVVGTTVEEAGFDASTVPAALDRLEAWARDAVPDLGPREDAWAGLRPRPPRPEPVIARLGSRVIAAVGHYRNGILLAPATGRMVRALALHEPPPVPAEPFAP
jgi:glycine oxidase